MENLVWALIVVSYTANVSFSTGYPTEAICQDAMSIARTGYTVAEKAATDRRDSEAAKKRVAEYQEKNPARSTQPGDEKKCFDGRTFPNSFGSSGSYCAMENDGMTRFYPTSLSVFSGGSSSEIKFAKCVQVPK